MHARTHQPNSHRLLALAVFALGLSTSTALAHKANTQASIAFDPTSPVVEGTMVTVTATVIYDGTCRPKNDTCDHPGPNAGDPITGGSIQIQQLQDAGGNGVPCDTGGASFGDLGAGSPDANGQFSIFFDTTALAGQTIGFRSHHPATGGAHGDSQSASDCMNLVIVSAEDPLPDGTTGVTQGFYGASPNGEAVVSDLIDQATCEAISAILADIGIVLGLDCSSEADQDALADFVTGEVGPGSDDGFLPSGFEPGQNLAAQAITLLLNLNLGEILVDPAIPMSSSYFLNIDVVEDLFGDPPMSSNPPTCVDPLFNIPELAVCDDGDVNMVCDCGTVALSTLGLLVSDLDDAGTTVQEILDAALSLLASGDADIDVNGDTLTRDDVTDILGLINESYDEGVPTGFVTAFDADDAGSCTGC